MIIIGIIIGVIPVPAMTAAVQAVNLPMMNPPLKNPVRLLKHPATVTTAHPAAMYLLLTAAHLLPTAMVARLQHPGQQGMQTARP